MWCGVGDVWEECAGSGFGVRCGVHQGGRQAPPPPAASARVPLLPPVEPASACTACPQPTATPWPCLPPCSPTRPPPTPPGTRAQLPPRHTFLDLCIGDHDFVDAQGWKFVTLPSLITTLGLTNVALVKMDMLV